jgi:cytochrome c-type biogenesis protein CcsB
MDYGAILLFITLGFYSAAVVLYLWSLRSASDRTRVAIAFAVAGLATHAGVIVASGVEQRRAPFTSLYDSVTFAAWAMMAIYLVMQRRHRMTALGAAVSLIALAAVAFGATVPKGPGGPLSPAFASRWSTIHVVTSLIGYASFALAFSSALVHVLQERLLKAKRIDVLQKRLPSLDALDRFSYSMVALGFPMFTLGIVTGSLWAQSAWGSYWSWDPKETWSLITWLVYAAYLHVRMFLGWRGKLANRLLVAGFTCVLITYLGVSFLGRGLHRY